MLLNVAENLEIASDAAIVWTLLNDTPRLAVLVPGVAQAVRKEGEEREIYQVRVTEKVGPFKITMNLEVVVTERVDLTSLSATLKGGDAMGMGRASGAVQVVTCATPAGTSVAFTANVEIVGKLAALGAPVVRRRVADLFAEFSRRVKAELATA